MRRKHRRPMRKPTELLLVPMIDIFTVLVTFLLMTAVFSRITIVELDLPSAASPSVTPPSFRLEVIVKKEGFELTNGTSLIATIPKVNGAYDLKSLGDLALSLKRDYPTATNASVLLQPDIEYDNLIQVMDVIRSAELPADSELLAGLQPAGAPAQPAVPEADAAKLGYAKAAPHRTVRVALFTDIAVGDAP
ncbi:MAG: biopolymer transporter ExbD [Deltaproteobacteria bacterium]|nr:MAG: biopolymer transporter ExbD [Deltaproteobacteria bacterium]